MVATAASPRVTPEAYLARERDAVEKHEYWRGDVFQRASSSMRHNVLVVNLMGELHGLLRERPYFAFGPDMKVHIPAKNGFVYPDVSVVCNRPELYAGNDHVITNPVVVVEVLSPGTEAFDRGEKFDGYASVTSVQDYVLVSQVERRIEVFSRQPDGAWLLRITREREHERAALPSLALELALDEVYAKVFDEPAVVA
jgi:Uma2 family endonuclease